MVPYDCIVLGTGGIGSGALYHLARRGLKVLGLDRFPPAHDRGSSHGDTRVIRLVYMEHPNYVPLLHRAYELWEELQEETGKTLYVEAGLLQVGPTDGFVVRGARASAAEHGLDVDELSPAEVQARFPGIQLDASQVGLFERRAGFLYVEECVRTHIDAARRSGAELVTGEVVTGWSYDDRGVEVVTDAGSYSAAKLVITAGPWSGELLRDLGVPLIVRRKPLLWYGSGDSVYKLENGMSTFFFETDFGVFYGFPEVDDWGLKVAEHSGGEVVSDPLQVDRELRATDRASVERFMSRYLPRMTTTVRKSAVCMYTVTPDEHFLVDVHPDAPHVAFAAGLSGHGFKFAGVLGEALADLIESGKTDLPIDFLSCRRFG